MNDGIKKEDISATGIITGIGHGTTRDGPGWRTIIYFKGCNFHCPWCGSPETISSRPELLLYPELEKNPARAAASCPLGAITISASGGSVTDRSICDGCSDISCTRTCADGSRERAGYLVSATELATEAAHYKRFHKNYGVTLSGGEATLQWDFFLATLNEMKTHGLHTAVETNGSNPRLPEASHLLDLVICDFKHPDPETHCNLVGSSNKVVLENIKTISDKHIHLWVRIPLVPGINDGDHLKRTAELLGPFRDKLKIEILGYHRLGLSKWRALGTPYPAADPEPPTISDIDCARRLFIQSGYTVINT